MKSTFRILFFLKRDKVKTDGTFPIMCRITIDGQMSRFNTKLSINPKVWDVKSSTAIGKSNEATEINSLLNEIKTSIYNVYHDLQTKENNVNAERVKNIFLGIEVKHQTVLELFQRQNDDIAKLVGISKSKKTLFLPYFSDNLYTIWKPKPIVNIRSFLFAKSCCVQSGNPPSPISYTEPSSSIFNLMR